MGWQDGYLVTVILIFLFVNTCSAKFINFKPGYEYIYSFSGHSTVKDLGKFNVHSKVSYTNIESTQEGQQLLLKIYSFRLSPQSDPNLKGVDIDFSRWFSFVITPTGEIVKLYHPADEDQEILATKKGFAALFASRLYQQGEVPGEVKDDKFVYTVTENGHEGEHKATYLSSKSPHGINFKKIRHAHPVMNAKSTYTKTLEYRRNLGTIHKVKVEEDFTSPTVKDSFDPYEGMRKVAAENSFEEKRYPDMWYVSEAELRYLAHKIAVGTPTRENLTYKLEVSSVKVEKAKPLTKYTSMTDVYRDIAGNLTCMDNQPRQGSSAFGKCFRNIINIMDSLNEGQVKKVASFYFDHMQNRFQSNQHAINNMVDVFGSLDTDVSQRIIVEKILKNPKAMPTLIVRVISHIVSRENAPHWMVLPMLEDAVFRPDHLPTSYSSPEVHHRAMLALGSVIRKLKKEGESKKASELTEKLHSLHGTHDPWSYRKKRAAMSESERQNYDQSKVVLLEALGNAGMDQSYVFILSYVNSTNSPWIKRAGCHALRKYHHQKAADTLLSVALRDEDRTVREEALILYKSHPYGKMAGPMDKRFTLESASKGHRNLEEFDVNRHIRKRRALSDSVWDGINLMLEAPMEEWRKLLGSTDLGASFGVLLMNRLDLQIAPYTSDLHIRTYDEAYARIHLGLLNRNVDFFNAKLCFKGSSQYNVNIFQNKEMTRLVEKAADFDVKIAEIVNTTVSDVELFKDLITSRVDMGKIVGDLSNTTLDLEDKVAVLQNTSIAAMRKMGQYDLDALPPAFSPLVSLVQKVTQVFDDIRIDVLGFKNEIEELVSIVIPQQAKIIYESLKDMIDGYQDLVLDPKTAILNMGKGVNGIGDAVSSMMNSIQQIESACFFLKDTKPYWFDIESLLDQYTAMLTEAAGIAETSGNDWVNEIVEESEDQARKISHGKVTIQAMRQQVVTDMLQLKDDLLQPFQDILDLSEDFMSSYDKYFEMVKLLKITNNIVKEGYELSRSTIDTIFGAKAHRSFPRQLRLAGSGCQGHGQYPSTLQNVNASEYSHPGVDVPFTAGASVIAPFPGEVTVDPSDNMTLIINGRGSLQGIIMYLTNIIPNDTLEEGFNTPIAAGQIMGTAAVSVCTNHIHMAFKMAEGGYIDPTKYLDYTVFERPQWISECDDYKLMFKDDTVAAGVIIGVSGQTYTNADPQLSNANLLTTLNDPDSAADPDDTVSIKTDPSSMYSSVMSQLSAIDDIDDSQDNCTAPSGSSASTSDTYKRGLMATLLKTANIFLSRYSLQRLKIGTVMEFLDRFGLTTSRDALGTVLTKIKDLLIASPCLNPYEMTTNQLAVELMERSQNASGTRKSLLQRLLDIQNVCPWLSYSMPSGQYCNFDPLCLGMECCINVKIILLIKSFKAWMRFDPCVSPMKLTFAVDSIVQEININSSVQYDGFEGETLSGSEIQILGGLELILSYRVEKWPESLFVDFTVRLCSFDNTDNCVYSLHLLKNAILPIPQCASDGTLQWPSLSYAEIFNRYTFVNSLKGDGKNLVEQDAAEILEKFIAQLGLTQELLNETGPCPRPDGMTIGQLQTSLTARGLSTTGNRDELEARLLESDTSCNSSGTNVTLQNIVNTTSDRVYLTISGDCMRLDACVSLTLPVDGVNYTQSMKAYIDLDPCSFVMILGFEQYRLLIVLLSYPWGEEKIQEVTQNIHIKYLVDRNETQGVYNVSFGLRVCPTSQSSCLLDDYFIVNEELPIPVCSDYTLPGGGTIAGLLATIGGKMTKEAFDLILKQFELDVSKIKYNSL